MVTVPDRLLELPEVALLHRSPGLLEVKKVLSRPLYERQSYLRMHALIGVRSGRQRIGTDRGQVLRIGAGDTRLLPRGLYTVSDLLPEDGATFQVRILYFDERALADRSATGVRRRLLDELRAIPDLEALTAARRLDPLPFLERHYDKPLTLADFALLTGSSVSTFQRAFRRQTGKSPRQWIIDRRMARARELRQEQRLPTQELALAVGYANVSHFIRQYRLTFGHTPAES